MIRMSETYSNLRRYHTKMKQNGAENEAAENTKSCAWLNFF